MEELKTQMKIKEGIWVQDIPFCLLCGSEGILFYKNLRDRLFSAPGIWALMRCPKCGLVWLNPRPIYYDISKIYRKYFTHEVSYSPPKLEAIRKLARNSILASHFGYVELFKKGIPQKVFGRFLSLIGPIREKVELSIMTLNAELRGKLLDVGCGTGAFLTKMRDLGWEVTGVEPDEEAVKVAQERFRLNILKATLEEAEFPENEFNAITMNHVIEHLPDPVGTLKECSRVLKTGGRLVVVTPNAESLGAQLFNNAWRGWEVPRHFQIFSLRTLQDCVEKAGLQIVNFYTTAKSAYCMWKASYLIQRNDELHDGSPHKQNFWLRLLGLSFRVIEYGLCRMMDVGEELVLIATK
jgi:2-polyprenyl-3-methyl-5-hydroxy-6-metoxy-1,4-benzoquinol methylase/rRNA maturation protein Nop10